MITGDLAGGIGQITAPPLPAGSRCATPGAAATAVTGQVCVLASGHTTDMREFRISPDGIILNGTATPGGEPATRLVPPADGA